VTKCPHYALILTYTLW